MSSAEVPVGQSGSDDPERPFTSRTLISFIAIVIAIMLATGAAVQTWAATGALSGSMRLIAAVATGGGVFCLAFLGVYKTVNGLTR